MSRWRPAYVALGSNLADPASQVATAIERLPGIADSRLVACSRLWSSRPLGLQDQPDFVNAVAGLLTRLTARQLLDALQRIELEQGRTRLALRVGAPPARAVALVLGTP